MTRLVSKKTFLGIAAAIIAVGVSANTSFAQTEQLSSEGASIATVGGDAVTWYGFAGMIFAEAADSLARVSTDPNDVGSPLVMSTM